MADAPKRSKEAVDYGRGMKAAHCGICRHFLAPDRCSRVAGKVSAQGWCRLWTKKAVNDADG